MSEEESDVPGRSDEQALNDRMESGGGCAEAWEAAQEIRDEKRTNSNRRQLLSGIGAALLFGTSVTNTVNAQSDDDSEIPDVEVEELTGEEKTKGLKKALLDPQVEKIEAEFQNRGMKQDLDSAVVQRATGEGEPSLTVRIPHNISDDSGKAVEKYAGIIWSSWSDGLTHGFVSKREMKPDAQLSPEVKKEFEEDDLSSDSDEIVPVEVSYTKFGATEVNSVSSDQENKPEISIVDSLSEETDSLVVPVKKSSSKEVSQQGTGDCICTAVLGTNPVTACAPCGTVKPDCLSQIVANFGGSLGACGGCAAGAIFTSGGAIIAACIPCFGMISEEVASGDIKDVCCWCNFGGGIV
jgi:hypothetical protein